MENLPIITETKEGLHDGLTSSEETIDSSHNVDSNTEGTYPLPEIRTESPLHYVDCEDTGHCEDCEKGTHRDEDCQSVSSSYVGDDLSISMDEDMTISRESSPFSHFLTIRRDPKIRGQFFRKDKRLSMILSAGLDPGKPPVATSRSMEHLAVSSGHLNKRKLCS